jgi:hypothetical protein
MEDAPSEKVIWSARSFGPAVGFSNDFMDDDALMHRSLVERGCQYETIRVTLAGGDLIYVQNPHDCWCQPDSRPLQTRG